MAVTPADLAAAMLTGPVAARDWLVILPVALPILSGGVLLMLRNRLGLQGTAACLLLAVNVVLAALLLAHVSEAGPRTMMMGAWLPPFGIAFTVDPLGALMALTANLVALACAIHSLGDIDARRARYGYWCFLLLMMAGVNGAFLTGDIFNLYVWFEVLLIGSFGLIVSGSEPRQLDGTLKYAFLNLLATTLFLIAVGYLYGVAGTLNMADLVERVRTLPAGAPLATLSALFALAFAMKAAAFPLNFWLPASYHVPRLAVSALFAGVLTKVGIYALLRVNGMILTIPSEALAGIVSALAGLTMLTGALGALAQSDLRRLLGYLVIGGIGAMLAGLAVPGEMARTGTVAYAVHSMLTMTGLYLVADVIGRRAGSHDLRALGGFLAASPRLAIAFFLLALAVAGLPPLTGFWPKVMLVRASLAVGDWWLVTTILVSALLTSLAIMRVWLFAFWRGGPEGTRDGAEAWRLPALVGGARAASALAIALPLGAMLVLTVAPEPLVAGAAAAARGTLDPGPYLQSVFGGVR